MAECARTLGVSNTTIYKGMKTGRFKVYIRKVNNLDKKFVDLNQARHVFKSTVTSSGSPPRGGGLSDIVSKRTTKFAKKVAKKIVKGNVNVNGKKGKLELEHMFDMHDIRLETERLKAQKAKFDFELLQGKYISFEEVLKEFKHIAETLKSSVLAIPNRIGALVAAETDEHVVQQMLIIELKKSLTGIVKSNIVNKQLEIEE